MKYIKRPVMIEAVQLTETNVNDIYHFMDIENKGSYPECDNGIDPSDGQFKIKTLEGVMTASVGDYIIKDVNGEFYPCKPDIFKKTYVEAEQNKTMDFGEAVKALKDGKKVVREGWNGKGMFVVFQKGYPKGITCNKQTAEAWGIDEGDLFKCEPYLQIKMVNGSHAMWVPSINDCLAEDWKIVK